MAQGENGERTRGGARSEWRGKRGLQPASELLGPSLAERARCADPKLRAQLVGSIIIRLVNSGAKYLFDWSGDTLKLEPTTVDQADCTIEISEANLGRIALGELNPQIAMLSDKIRASGKLSLAVYWFNLIVPGGGSSERQDSENDPASA